MGIIFKPETWKFYLIVILKKLYLIGYNSKTNTLSGIQDSGNFSVVHFLRNLLGNVLLKKGINQERGRYGPRRILDLSQERIKQLYQD